MKIIIIFFHIVCGGIIDSTINGKIEIPTANLSGLLCEWDFTNTNGTVVIIANIKTNEVKINCHDYYLLLATDGRYEFNFYPQLSINYVYL